MRLFKMNKHKGISVLLSVICVAGFVSLAGFSISVLTSRMVGSFETSNTLFQANQYALTRAEIISSTSFDLVTSMSKTPISGTKFSEEVTYVNDGDKKKVFTINIYEGNNEKAIYSMNVTRNFKDIRLVDSDGASQEKGLNTLTQKAISDVYSLKDMTVKKQSDVGSVSTPVYFDGKEFKPLKYSFVNTASSSDYLVAWNGNNLDSIRKGDIPNLFKAANAGVPGYVVFTNGVVFAWGNYEYTNDNINQACAVTIQKPYKFQTLICQIQDSMLRKDTATMNMYRFGWANKYTTDTTETFAATGGKNLTVFWIGKEVK